MPKRSWRVHPVIITDLDFTDGISDRAKKALELLTDIVRMQEVLGCSSMLSRQKLQASVQMSHAVIHTIDQNILEVQDDFKYLGAYITTSGRDMKVCGGLSSMESLS